MEEGAAGRCKEAIEKALHYDQNNPEALQLMASYLFSIEKPEVHLYAFTILSPLLRSHLTTPRHPQSVYLTRSASEFNRKPSAVWLMLYTFFFNSAIMIGLS